MMSNRFLSLAWAILLVIGLCGCQTARQRALEAHRPRNLIFPAEKLEEPEIRLREGEQAAMILFERSGNQSLHVLQVAQGAMLQPRYHRSQDLTLLCIRGSAIVEVEETRYILNPRCAIFIPRLFTYKIVPHGSEEDFAAIAVFSPPYSVEDVVLLDVD